MWRSLTMIKCPQCSYILAKKNGHVAGEQRYRCKDCGAQFYERTSALGRIQGKVNLRGKAHKSDNFDCQRVGRAS